MTKRNRVKRVVAALFAVGSLAVAVPAASLADRGGTAPPPSTAEPGGGGH